MSEAAAQELKYEWGFWARGHQLPPDTELTWDTWLLLAGRGFGKTRTGAEYVRWVVQHGICKRMALVARTAGDVRDVMVEGESGIMAISPPWFKPKYEPSKRRLTWPNGAVATTFSADEPDQLRGPQFDGAWGDELASWKHEATYDNLMFGLRLGKRPRAVFTTTPRPVKLVKQLLKDERTFITRGSTFLNRANMAPAFFRKVLAKYGGTRLGRQELYAQVLEDTPGALWTLARIEILRVEKTPELVRIVVAVDPSVSDGENAAETGIIVIGIGVDGHLYVLEDASIQGSPAEWSTVVVQMYQKYHADRIVAESNQGGLMVEQTIRTVEIDGEKVGKLVPITLVHASRGKQTRAEPISALYEQGKAHHLGAFPELEDQMCTWIPGEKSPDRMDALVWGATALTENNTVIAVLGADIGRTNPGGWQAVIRKE